MPFGTGDPNDANRLEMVPLPTTVGQTSRRLGSPLQAMEPDADQVLNRLRDLGPPAAAALGPRPAEVRVRVFNGSGANGIATQAATQLRQQGFVTVGVGNQPRGSPPQVRYRPGSLHQARRGQ